MKLAYTVLLSFLTIFSFASSLDASDQPLGFPAAAVDLPKPVTDGRISLEKVLLERRSLREYKDLPLSLSDLSQLLWAAQGMIGAGGKRTAPSAGALYPLETYVAAGNVAGLPADVYFYDPKNHQLRRVAEGDPRMELSRAALGQSPVRRAPAVLAFSAVYERTTEKYGDRGIRYAHMEAGHAAQNVYLQATALGIGTVAMGAFDDDRVRKVMHMTEREHPLYLMPVGKK